MTTHEPSSRWESVLDALPLNTLPDLEESIVIDWQQPRPYQKESPTAWLWRVLDLPDDCKRVEVFRTRPATYSCLTQGSEQTARALSFSRAVAFESWWCNQVDPQPRQPHRPGAVFLLVDNFYAPKQFLLTRKDNKHPIASFRGKIAIPGGSLDGNENPVEGCMRELYEEITDVSVADTIAARLACLSAHSLTFPLRGTDTTYHLDVFATVMDDGDESLFERWKSSLTSQGGLSEAEPLVLNVDEMITKLADEKKRPYSVFAACHNVPLDNYLKLEKR